MSKDHATSQTTDARLPRRRTVIALVFAAIALPLAFAAATGLFEATESLVTWRSAADWVATPARVESVGLEEVGTFFGLRRRPIARFRYDVDGRTYVSENTSAERASDDPFQLDRHAVLSRHRDERTTLSVFVDPADPSRAIAFRDPTERLYIAPLQAIGLSSIAFVFLRWAWRAWRPRGLRRAGAESGKAE